MLCYRCGSYNPDRTRRCSVCGQAFSQQRRASSAHGTQQPSSSQVAPRVVKAPFEPGAVIAGRYKVGSQSAQGSSGWVLRARDQEVDVDVALKLVSQSLLQSEEEKQAFLRAVKAQKRVQHPNLARIYDEGRDERHVFYTTPWLEGLTLRKIVDLRLDKGQVFSVAEALPLVSQLALGIDALEKVEPHGALRPASVMVLPDMLKVTGLPHWQGLPRTAFVSLQQQKGSLEYLAPEARTDADIDTRADVYSLGVIFAEMLTGHVYGRDALGWTRALQALPRRLAAVLGQALSLRPVDRFATASSFFDALAEAIADLQLEGGEPVSLGVAATAMPDEPTGVESAPRPSPLLRKPAHPPPPQPAAVTPSLVKPMPIEVTPVVPVPEETLRRAAGVSERYQVGPLPFERRGTQPRGTKPQASGGKSGFVWALAAAIVLGGAAVAAALWLRSAPPSPELRPVTTTLRPSPTATISAAPQRRTKADKTEAPAPVPVKPEPIERKTIEVAERRPIDPSDRRPVDPGERRPIDPSERRPIDPSERRPIDPSERRPIDPSDRRPIDPGDRRPIDPGDRRPIDASERRPLVIAAPTPPAPQPVVAEKSRCPAGMIAIAGGGFEMGSAPSDPMRNFGELDQRSASTRPYCIDIYEFPNQRGKVPTANLNWGRAKQACEQAGKRLCSEAEWELACKGSRGARFPFGNELDGGACNIGRDARPMPAGELARCRSGFGVVDLAGNVAEWTASRFADDVPDKVVKGGAADQASYTGRCAARANEPPASRRDTLGFRCCADQ